MHHLPINTQPPSSPATSTLLKNLPCTPTTISAWDFNTPESPAVSPPELLTTRGKASIFAAHRSYMFLFSPSGIRSINQSTVHSHCIALIRTLVALLSERVKPASTNAAMPQVCYTCVSACRARVILPEDSGPWSPARACEITLNDHT
jgi:hypothetical protein